MNINNKNLKSFNADIVSFDIASSDINNNVDTPDGSLLPVLGKQIIKPQTRTLILDFINEEDINRFISEISSFSILDIDDGYKYKCFLNSIPSIVKDGFNAYTVSCQFLVIKQKELVTVVGKQFENQGNIETECIYEITASINLDSVSVNDYVIKNLKANTTFVIDGIDKVVHDKSSDISRFDDVVMSKFPRVDKGQNEIMVSSDKVEVVVKYYPTFIC